MPTHKPAIIETIPAKSIDKEVAHRRAVKRLTDKQKSFIVEYLVDYNATRAAGRAGYQCKTDQALGVIGYRLVRHPVVGLEIRRLGAATPDELGMTKEYVFTRLRDMVERWMSGEDDSPQSAARALEMVGKLRGDYIEHVQHDVRVLSVQLNDVNMDDLR